MQLEEKVVIAVTNGTRPGNGNSNKTCPKNAHLLLNIYGCRWSYMGCFHRFPRTNLDPSVSFIPVRVPAHLFCGSEPLSGTHLLVYTDAQRRHQCDPFLAVPTSEQRRAHCPLWTCCLAPSSKQTCAILSIIWTCWGVTWRKRHIYEKRWSSSHPHPHFR